MRPPSGRAAPVTGDDVRETITVHFTAKRGDWCDIWGNEDVSVWWNRLCDNVVPEKTMPFDLLTVLPTRLDPPTAHQQALHAHIAASHRIAALFGIPVLQRAAETAA